MSNISKILQDFIYSLYSVFALIDGLSDRLLLNLIELIYNKIKDLNVFLLLFFAFISFYFFKDLHEFYIYVSYLLLNLNIFIKLIILYKYWINNKYIKKNYPIFYYILKYILLTVLLFNMYNIIILIFKIIIIYNKLLIKYMYELKFNILKKLKSYLSSKLRRRFEPNGPNLDPDQIINMDPNSTKKKASELRKKVLKQQKDNLKHNIKKNIEKNSFNPQARKRNWNETISKQEVPNFTIESQLTNVKKEFEAYDNQTNKFNNIINNIDNGKEQFFPDESKPLFEEYVKMINLLKINLKNIEVNLNKLKKKKKK